eukprot:TRINITY_DN3189_c0_g2_i2.p2 TRINITY_DN3189_c0_g2~~TRINITY_DN3189_c0_g2_i2.p2  ORF type:complete len:281 (+),score=68.63 TRINITY_DN3189_c0_g2_i2:885-1727(+)
MFTNVLLLSNGKVVYFGPTQDIVEYFQEIGYSLPPFNNPADYFSDLLTPASDLLPDVPSLSPAELEALPSIFRQSTLFRDLNSQLEKTKNISPFSTQELIERLKHKKTGFWDQFMALLWRLRRDRIRSPQWFLANVGQMAVLSLAIGIAWWQLDRGQTSTRSRVGFTFGLIVIMFFLSAVNVVLAYSAEKAVMFRERERGAYSVLAYFLSKEIVDIISFTFYPLIYCLIFYWMTKFSFNDAEHFFLITFAVWFLAQLGSSLGVTKNIMYFLFFRCLTQNS